MQTKAKIIKTAIKLFNEHGAANISANGIAKEIGMSAGNLYYHFKSKEKIIRTIWEQMATDLDQIWSVPEIHHSEQAIAKLFHDLTSSFYDYRFFYLELPILLNNDDGLRKDYVERSNRIIKLLHVITNSWTAAGILKKLKNAEEKEMLIRNMWLVNQLWMHYWYTIQAKVTDRNLKEAMIQILLFYKPYLKPQSADRIRSYIDKM